VKRAPAWFRRYTLEWFYRLLTEPRRAIRQLALPHFVYRLVRARLAGNVLSPVDQARAGAPGEP
jgi:N-acetylglucosaminyldiphosphoundecaprenol N-acetyl-beta-D-mannosaminyltransferase